MAIEITAGKYGATIVSEGAGLASLTYAGHDIVLPHDPAEKPVGYNGKVLIPWPNRITNGQYVWEGETFTLEVNEPETGASLHGLSCWVDWEVTEHTESSATLRTRIAPTSGYPFHLETAVTYTLDPQTGLSISVATANTGDVPAPYGTSVHPYLTVGAPLDDCVISVPADTVLEVDADLSPTGDMDVTDTHLDLRGPAPMAGRSVDHAFTGLPDGTWTVSLTDPTTGRAVEMTSSERWVQIYSAENQQRQGVAVEPMTCPPNAFNSGTDLIVLQPGQTTTFTTAIRDVSPTAIIDAGAATLGIEFGSTRIKAVLVDGKGSVIASGAHDWENQLTDDLWSYPESSIWQGLQGAYASLVQDVQARYNTSITALAALGFSAMMHGYIALDEDGRLLTPFRTWRNTNTGRATEVLSAALDFNMPHRWSSAHLYQAAIDGEDHVAKIKSITTLAGLVHQRLSGRSVLGVGDASGMFPIDPATHNYDEQRLAKFDELLAQAGIEFSLRDVLPTVLVAGQDAGHLTEAGALLLDPSGVLQPGTLMCPPEGDAGTGMVATNAVAARTGNVSAGTSIFAMVVLEHDLQRVHPELDMVTTPDGLPVAMVHSNNGASEWDQWVGVFAELLESAGCELSRPALYDLAYAKALEGAPDGGGLVAYNFLSGEPVVGLETGRPLFFRTPDAPITLANFMRTQLMSIFGVLRLGMDILIEDEGVQLDRLFAHGGLFKTPVVAQTIMAAALKTPVTVSATAGEGGPWGMALLALYASKYASELSLPEFLNRHIFADLEALSVDPNPEDVAGFNTFLERYKRALPAEAAAGQNS